MRIQYACVSNRGLIRKSNQDNLVWEHNHLPMVHDGLPAPVIVERILNEPVLFGVFDGMGGEPRGDAASWIAASSAALSGSIRSGTELKDLCCRINREICNHARENRLSACGTTSAILLVNDHHVIGCNLGDSRIYQYRNGLLTLLSEDHVLPVFHSGKPPLLQYLGIPEEEMAIEPFLFQERLRQNDLYLICSDGLTDMLSEDQIIHAFLETGLIREQADSLLTGALASGGRDNISFILVRIADE